MPDAQNQDIALAFDHVDNQMDAVGVHPDGRPGEMFIKMAKEGSTMSGMCQAFCRAFSLAMQYGLSLEDAIVRFKGMRFEPMGSTSNPEVPECSSIVDYVARFLEVNFCEPSSSVPVSICWPAEIMERFSCGVGRMASSSEC